MSANIIQQEQSILEVSTQLEPLSIALRQSLQDEVAEYGATLAQFNVHSINVPEDDPAAVTLKAALAKKAEMGIVGFTYQQERSFDVMQTAAGNEGSAGSVMGAGLGAGLGLGVGASFGQAYNQMASEVRGGVQVARTTEATAPVSTTSAESAPIDAAERIRLLKELASLKADGVLTDSEFLSEKKKLLGS